MKESVVFALILFAVFHVFEAEIKDKPKTVKKTSVRKKAVTAPKRAAVNQKPRSETRITNIHITKVVNYRVVVPDAHQPNVHTAVYKPKPEGERRNYRKTTQVVKKFRSRPEIKEKNREEVESECQLKAPNFFGVETKCYEWRRTHGYEN